MDDGREKHPICDKCLDLKLPTTYLCGKNCPANPGAWELHGVFHKQLRKDRKRLEDGGAGLQRYREAAEEQARIAARTGDAYSKLLAEGGLRYGAMEDIRKEARTCREAIALRPDKPTAYINLGAALNNSGHKLSRGRTTEPRGHGRYPVGSEGWAEATAYAFDMLRHEECAEVAKPEWWNDEELKALSARVLRVTPNEVSALDMRAIVLSGLNGAWEAGPRSAAELKEAASCYERSAALCDAPAWKAEYSRLADECRIRAEAI